jgi:hypothetical protein
VTTTAKRVPKTLGEAAKAKRAHPLVAAIQDAQDIPYKDVLVPEWPDKETGEPIELRIRGLNGRERDRYEAQMATFRATDDGQMRINLLANRNARILAQCLYDPQTDEQLPISEEDLGDKSGDVVTRLAQIALNLSGLGRKSAEDAGKGSGTGQSGSSTSG